MNNNKKEVLLQVQDVHVDFGILKALNGVSLEIQKGEILAIIGPNGAGKTSLVNAINGFYHPSRGHIFFAGQDLTKLRPHQIAALGIARTFQNVALFKGMTVLDNLMVGRNLKMNSLFISQVIYWGLAQKEEIRHREAVERIIDWLEIEHIRKVPAGMLPYGLQKRVELGRALAAEPQLLLLDEPMAGMNLEEKEDIVRFILDANEELGVTIALIEHDMGVVMDISDRVIVLDYGEKIAEGTPHFPIIQEIMEKVYGAGKGNLSITRVGTVFYNRGVVTGIVMDEALRTAQKKFGVKVITGEEMRWALENLDITEARIKEIGAEGLLPPIKTSWKDHEGGGWVRFQQWDGSKWVPVGGWIEPLRDFVRKEVEESAAKYAKEKGITPRTSEALK